jgi:mannonate dehydratase
MMNRMPSITAVDVFATRPATENLVVVRLRTDDGLAGYGCATFTQRHELVMHAVESYLKPLVLGRDATRIRELWRLMDTNSYWRGGPVLRNAISGIDTALWDLAGKRAGQPVVELLGGKVRESAAVYQHVSGRDPAELLDAARATLATGVSTIRVQIAAAATDPDRLAAATAGYGGSGVDVPTGALPGAYYDPILYRHTLLDALAHLRQNLPREVGLIHDVHSRLNVAEATAFAQDLRGFDLFFLEDALPPEHAGELHRVRAAAPGVPLAIGELFTERRQWLDLVARGMIDFLRCHLSAIGGFTPAVQADAVCEAHGCRTAWHGPKDTSPIGHAAGLHLNLASHAFGIQECPGFTDAEREIFPGLPTLADGVLRLADDTAPGWGVDFDETAAARFPPKTEVIGWTQARRPDGALFYP